MSAKTLILAIILLGFGPTSRGATGESEAPAAPRPEGFERWDHNHDGVIQREEFEHTRRERGDRQRVGREGGEQRERAARGEALARRIDEAIERALAEVGGDLEQLRPILRRELMESMREARGPRSPMDGPPPPRDADDTADRWPAPPRDGQTFQAPRERGERRGRRGGFRGGDPEERAKRVMERLDDNHDGALSADELGDRAERWMKGDADGDGQLNETEVLGCLRKAREKADERRRGENDPPRRRPAPPPAE